MRRISVLSRTSVSGAEIQFVGLLHGKEPGLTGENSNRPPSKRMIRANTPCASRGVSLPLRGRRARGRGLQVASRESSASETTQTALRTGGKEGVGICQEIGHLCAVFCRQLSPVPVATSRTLMSASGVPLALMLLRYEANDGMTWRRMASAMPMKMLSTWARVVHGKIDD